MTQVKYLSKFILMFVLASFLGCASTSKLVQCCTLFST